MGNTLSNAAYLACSWLWCLGGFLPLILARDYGWPALLAFTIFNVGGAMAMGFYFKHRSQQSEFEQSHKHAIKWFSFVTIAYQVFFITWLSAVIGQPWIIAGMFALASLFYISKGAITAWAVAIYVVSIVLFVDFFGRDWPAVDIAAKAYWPHALLPLAIGFILSPYLDISFHKAYKNSTHPRASFMLGFGVMFLSLLIFVFFYAGSLGEVFFKQAIPAQIIYPVVAFLMMQTAFTISAHVSQLRLSQLSKPVTMMTSLAAITLVAAGIVFFANNVITQWVEIALEETIYKTFLFFYSLVFPLYLLLGQFKSLYLWTLALCTPAYSIGFLLGGNSSFALSVGVAIIATALIIKQRKLTIKHSSN
ncbi:hypothetical protein ACFO4O_01885 [Glaciecola siphonariae]|uniref:Uncharacterized protein n=1 Tax=Glaciecola siphonariae TaxID=521012 RepID=A0ABV9LRR7_9ALTE